MKRKKKEKLWPGTYNAFKLTVGKNHWLTCVCVCVSIDCWDAYLHVGTHNIVLYDTTYSRLSPRGRKCVWGNVLYYIVVATYTITHITGCEQQRGGKGVWNFNKEDGGLIISFCFVFENRGARRLIKTAVDGTHSR